MNKKVALALLSMILVPLAMMAQSVTVSPSTGNLVAALTGDNEAGFQMGMSAMWRHEQLPLDFTVSDGERGGSTYNPTYSVPVLKNGVFQTPACNMFFYEFTEGTTGNTTKVKRLVIAGGSRPDSYFMLSLPKGYRFKSYKLVLLNNLIGQTLKTPAGYDVEFAGSNQSNNKTVYETTSSFSTSGYKALGYYATNTSSHTMSGIQSSTNEYVIERKSEEPSDMGNQLYFRIAHNGNNSSGYFGVTIKSFTIEFTSEGTFDTGVAPISDITKDVAKSLVMAPFKTNKIDIGGVDYVSKPVNPNQPNGEKVTLYAYTADAVDDINAYAYIYQKEAIQNDVPMDVAAEKKIFPVTIGGKQYFAFGNGTYYVEAPTQVYSQTGLTYPIGYRIVGAKFTPQWSNQTVTGGTSGNLTKYFITYTSDGTTYYLNDQLRFSTTRFGWDYDSGTGSVSTGTSIYTRYLACEGSGPTRYLTFSTSKDNWFNLIVFNRDGTNYIGWDNDAVSERFYLNGTTDGSAVPQVLKDNKENAVQWGRGTVNYTYPNFAAGSYKLEVYNNDGSQPKGSATVGSNGSGAGTPIDLTDKSNGYNNDAIKFVISGLPEGKQALVDVSISLQALNPYIDQMNLICHDSENQLTRSQNFDAQDFRLSGGDFTFYIPSGDATRDLRFTFSNLYSQYGDNTYYPNDASLNKDGYARYSFVTSPYFSSYDGVEDGGLYDANYVGTETNVQPGAKIAYNDKVHADEVGNIRFKFNNAADLVNTASSQNKSYLQEYPFSVTNYIDSKDPDGTTTTGNFVDCTMKANATTSTTYYIFTADETRYNIAPSKAWQHRYYAFYRMDIKLETHTYDPHLTWTKVYNKTCYNKDGSLAEDDMWGLKLETYEHNTSNKVTGYLTVQEIIDKIDAEIKDSSIDTPTSKDQILYVDGGDLHSILNSTTTGDQPTTMDIGTLKQAMAENVLIYLPANTTTTLDNCASKPKDWTTGTPYNAGHGIVLTDNRPFYAPYDIFVDVDNIILHERKVTIGKNGKVTSASIIMPFGILIDENGTHTNLDGGSFKLHQMEESSCLTDGEGEDYVYFPVLKDVKKSEPNVPYLVEVIKAPEGEGADQISFVLSQKGGLIKATGVNVGNNWDYTYAGETGSGTKDKTTYTFNNHGSYSGKLLDKEGNFFYFAKNMFLCSNDYVYDDGIKVAPFRAYYSSTSQTSTRAASPLKAFDVIPTTLGDINIDGVVTTDDANGILNVILGKEEPKRLQTIMSDVNNDGAITIADVTKLVNMVLQNQTQTEE